MQVENANPYGPLDQARLTKFEVTLGARLPDQYREFLSRYNGGRWVCRIFRISEEDGETEIHHVYGLHDGPDYCRLERVWSAFRDRIPSSVIAIGDDPGGNKICVGVHGEHRGKVFFWAHDVRDKRNRSPLWLISTSFEEFVRELGRRRPDVTKDEVGELIKQDDKDGLAKLVEKGAVDIEHQDGNGRTLIERAAIAASPKIIGYLLGKGADLRGALELAKTNAEFFKEHEVIVALLERARRN